MKPLLVGAILALFTSTVLSNPVSNNCTPTLYAATSDGFYSALVISTDSGTTWQNRSPPRLYADLWAVFALNTEIFLAVSDGVEISPDSGESYKYTSLDYYIGRVYAEPTKILVSGYDYIYPFICMSEDGGATFTPRTDNPGGLGSAITGVYLLGDRVFVVANGTQGGIAVTDDAINWTVLNTKTGLNTSIATCISGEGQNVYVGLDGDGGWISISEDGGNSFLNQQTTTLGSGFVTSIFAAGGKVYVGTSGGGITIAETSSLWNSWTVKTVGNGLVSNTTTGIAAVGDTIIVGTGVGLSVSTDGGETWATKTTVDGLQHNRVTAVFANCA